MDTTMIKFGELTEALTGYICNDAQDDIPYDYYRCVFKTVIQLNNDGKRCDINQAASVLLYLAFNDDHLNPSQLTENGLAALDHAEKFLQKIGTSSDEIDEQLIRCR